MRSILLFSYSLALLLLLPPPATAQETARLPKPAFALPPESITVTATKLRWSRFVRQVSRYLRWSPAPWLNGLSVHSVRGDNGSYQIFLVM